MRLAILAPLRFPIAEPFHGGLEMHTHLLARKLEASGHEVTLFAHPDSDSSFRLQPVSLAEHAGFGGQVFAYRKAVKQIKAGRFDAVHNNSIHFLPPLLAGSLNCPVITTLHTPPYKSLRIGGRLSVASNHQFVSISKHLHDTWSPYIGEHQVIHNGLDETQWAFSSEATPNTAVWFGRFTPEKGAEYAIAAAKSAGFRLTLAGPVYNQQYFQQKIAPLFDEQITYAGHIDQQQLSTLIGSSSVGMVTSVWDEPFGLAYIEIAACGTPVAAFASGAAPEVVLPDMGTIVPKRDIKALAQVLSSVQSKDRALCRAAALDNFSADRMVKKYLHCYSSHREA